MTRGVLLFAFNNDKVDYYSMAVATAKRANKFLNLPVTVVTDKTTDLSKYTYQFDNVIIVEADRNNLNHVGKNTIVHKDTDTAYTVIYDNWQRGKIRKEYCTVSDMDFHMMNKENFMELVNE